MSFRSYQRYSSGLSWRCTPDRYVSGENGTRISPSQMTGWSSSLVNAYFQLPFKMIWFFRASCGLGYSVSATVVCSLSSCSPHGVMSWLYVLSPLSNSLFNCSVSMISLIFIYIPHAVLPNKYACTYLFTCTVIIISNSLKTVKEYSGILCRRQQQKIFAILIVK